MKTEKLYSFQDFCAEWSQKVRGGEMSRQAVYIIKETDLFKSLFPLLKTLSSGILEKEHWKQFWTAIRADRALTTEGLRLGDMLNHGRALLEKQSALQELIARAQGQATLREALQQLAIWWETAEFEITIYEGKKGKCPLIREWKQMTSRVSDNAALVASLKESRWVGRFAEQIENYERKIGKI